VGDGFSLLFDGVGVFIGPEQLTIVVNLGFCSLGVVVDLLVIVGQLSNTPHHKQLVYR